MAGVYLKLKCEEKREDIFTLGEQLGRELNNRGAEKIGENERFLGGSMAYFLAFERYYLRNGSYASLSIMLTESGNVQTADIVGSGGGAGIFNFSLGANTDFLGMAADILQKFGFVFEEE